MSSLFTTYDIFALSFATIIFVITIFLLITRVIGFWITLLLLLFTLATGLIVGNFPEIREYLRCSKQVEKVEKQVALLNEKVDHLFHDIDQLKTKPPAPQEPEASDLND